MTINSVFSEVELYGVSAAGMRWSAHYRRATTADGISHPLASAPTALANFIEAHGAVILGGHPARDFGDNDCEPDGRAVVYALRCEGQGWSPGGVMGDEPDGIWQPVAAVVVTHPGTTATGKVRPPRVSFMTATEARTMWVEWAGRQALRAVEAAMGKRPTVDHWRGDAE